MISRKSHTAGIACNRISSPSTGEGRVRVALASGYNILADHANVSQKYYKDVIPGLTRNPGDRDMPWIPDEGLGNDGKVRCSVKIQSEDQP
jgi:hypothetical protein